MIPIEPEDTLETVSKKIKDKVSGIRDKKDKKDFSQSPNIICTIYTGFFLCLGLRIKINFQGEKTYDYNDSK